MTERCDVAIVGGGPVGLLLGCLLTQRGFSVRVFEQQQVRREHSRAVGVHPPGLACLAQAGVAEQVLSHSVRVRRAYAFGDARLLGQVSFHSLRGPYPFVLTVPQYQTERALEQRLHALSAQVLERGVEVVSCRMHQQGAKLELRATGAASTHPRVVEARFVVGCDGKPSALRRALLIPYRGGAYREHFVMADTADETEFADAAAVFLAQAGVVESFPLPNGTRRWVVGLGARARDVSATLVEQLVYQRTGRRAPARSASMVSSFTAEHFLADRFVQGSAILAGDAAHVVSPIGGQGMNLGWLDVSLLDDALARAFATPAQTPLLLQRYQHVRRRAAVTATRRAALFMSIGQTKRWARLRDLSIRGMLSPWFAGQAAELFTMRGLSSTLSQR